MQFNVFRGRYSRGSSLLKTLRIMRITAVFLLAAGLQVSAGTMSQTVTFRGKGDVLKEVFNAIEKQTGYVVFYSKNLLNMAKTVDLNVQNMPLESFLDTVLSNQPLKYVIENKSILISPKPNGRKELADTELRYLSTMIQITGTVTDSTGAGLTGASVTVKGTRNTVVTDASGRFSINANTGDVLVISFIGYQTREVRVGTETSLRIVLRIMQAELEDIAVINTGYQRLSKRELASAVSQVRYKDIELGSKFSVDQMLAGQIPGLMSLQSSGEPGATPKIRIRGTSSIIGGSAPLWVLDDIILEDPVPVDLSNLNSPDAAYLIGTSIAGINPNDIETITVLKDASATAIYGSRAANGVIVITTKKGRVGKPQINYSSNISINKRITYGDLNLMNAGERIQLSQEIIDDNLKYSRTPRRLGYEGLYLDYLDRVLSYDEFKAAVQKMAENNTDWYDLLFRNSVTNNHALSLSGGMDRTTYYASLNLSDVQGAAKGSDQKRYSAMLKLNSWLSDKFYMGLQVNASNSRGRGFHSSVNPNKYAYETARTIPAYNDDGTYFMYLTEQKSQEFPAVSAPKEDMLYNILNETALTGAKSDVSNITAQLNLEYKFLSHFRYRFTGGFDQALTNSKSWAEERSNFIATKRLYNAGTLVPGTDAFNNSVIPWGGILNNSDQRKYSYTVRNTIDFNRVFAEDHLINAMAGQEIRSLQYKGMSGTYYGWQPERGNTVSPALTNAYLGILNSLRPVITDNINNNLSWFGSLTYTFRDKITVNGNIRADGSNNFGDNPKYRFLPIWSMAGKYTISNEEFLRNSEVISYLAFRGSYGLQGNIDKATSPDLIIRVGGRDGTTGFNESYFQYLANPDLRWEKTNSYNVGLEFALFGRKGFRTMDMISATIDLYDKKGTDIIVTRRVSQVIGMDQVKINGGKVRNTGIEGSLRVVPVQTKDFSASVTVIASYNKNELVEANKELNITNDNKVYGNALVEGKPIGSFYSYPYAGLNEKWGFPMFYNDKGEKRYNLYDFETELVYSGVNIPDVSGGINVNLRYKGLYAGLSFQYALGGVGRLPNFYRFNYYAAFDALANVSKELNDRWRKPGDELYTDIPVIYDNNKFNQANTELNAPVTLGTSKTPLAMYDLSDLRTEKTDNLRLRSLNLKYVFQPRQIKRLGLKNLAVNFQTENIFLLANDRWQGRDPESGSSNTPLPKVYTFGVEVGI